MNERPADGMPMDVIRALDSWIDGNGWAGWDPYDIKGTAWVTKLAEKASGSSFHRYMRELLYEFFYRFPRLSRTLLGVEKDINPKAMGLFASAYLQLYGSAGEDAYLRKAEYCLGWLEAHSSGTAAGRGWGYPFDWQSTRLIPAGTPNGIVSTAAGEAFWDFYRFSGDARYLSVCTEVCTFLSSLPRDSAGEDKICFSYTPLYQNHVHNLNLFVAEYLIKVGIETGKKEWADLGNAAVNYTLADQRADGSFDYNGPPEKPQNFIDHYHTGFVLRMLHSTWMLTGREDVRKALERCYVHYLDNFFEDGRIPKLMPGRKYRIDIHSSAESILCISSLSETWPEHLPLAGKVLEWTVRNLMDSSGYFYYGILRSRLTGLRYKSRIPYMRWGQAWMMRAMASYYAVTNRTRHD